MGETTEAFLSVRVHRKTNKRVEEAEGPWLSGEEGLGVPGCPGAWLEQELLGLATDTLMEGSCHLVVYPLPSGPGFCSGRPQARESQQS